MARIRVEVAFDSPVVFAGETLGAKITFRNVGNQEQQHSFSHARQRSVADRRLSTSGDHQPVGLQREDQLQRSNTTIRRHNPRNSMSIPRTGMDTGNEGLLMGFVQVQGFFQVENGFISSEAFDQVRKHGVVVGKHGLGYGSSSGGFLKGLTSLLQVKEDSTEDQSVPIFSTPQSLLFVDLKLEPGQSKTFQYNIKLPKELPPSCRAKTLRIVHNMVIGTQKLDRLGRPQPRTVMAPFRVFPHIDGLGNQPVYSLNDPIVWKTDVATVVALDENTRKKHLANGNSSSDQNNQPANTNQQYKQEEQEFLTYINELLSSNPADSQSHSRHQIAFGSRPGSLIGNSISAPVGPNDSCRQNIDYFVKYHDQIDNTRPLTKSKFEIGRGDQHIATVSLSKPVYRLGEEVLIFLDFSRANLKCHHITLSLETTEKITDLSIAVNRQWDQETQRQTRRITSQLASSTFDISKTNFQLTIPPTSTPQFATSGVALNWGIRFEFLTSLGHHSLNISDHHSDGAIAMPHESIQCDLFSCQIPLTVLPTNQDIGALVETPPRRWII